MCTRAYPNLAVMMGVPGITCRKLPVGGWGQRTDRATSGREEPGRRGAAVGAMASGKTGEH